MDHMLKTWPEFFRAVKSGAKCFEVRRHDRDYRVGDTLILQEYDPNNDHLSGDSITLEVVYLLPGGQLGVEAGYCVMGLSPCHAATADPVSDRARLDCDQERLWEEQGLGADEAFAQAVDPETEADIDEAARTN